MVSIGAELSDAWILSCFFGRAEAVPFHEPLFGMASPCPPAKAADGSVRGMWAKVESNLDVG